ncbi:MAG: magnesium transporter, partial [Pedobacter sp.]|nr:magnesium transporter [Pedobacter sp.]
MEEQVVEEVVELIERNDNEQLKVFLDDLNISDVEHLIDELPQYAVKFIDTLSIKRAVNVFRILDFPTQEKIIKKLDGEKLAELINLL